MQRPTAPEVISIGWQGKEKARRSLSTNSAGQLESESRWRISS
jgi:hypothetical protein